MAPAQVAESALAPGLARKVKRCLAASFDEPDIREALDTLSGIYFDNSTTARRELRATIEGGLADLTGGFLEATDAVLKETSATEQRLHEVASSASAAAAAARGGGAATAALVARADTLAADLAATQRKAATLQRFLADYQLSPDDATALRGSARSDAGTTDIGPAFFDALERVQRVHANCRALLHSSHQRAGLALLDSMASYQEAAYERLCKWVQAQCAELAESEVGDVHPLLPRAAAALRGRPVLLRYCADEVATARHGALFQAFLIALTQGGPGGVPRAIELQAHNPSRYVGDMLVWVHQACAGEREMLEGLFLHGEGDERRAANDGAAGGDGSGDLASPHANASDGVSIPALLDTAFEGLCRPLRARLEQILLAVPPPLLAFQLSQLLTFYAATLGDLIGAPTAAIVTTVSQVADMALSAFQEQMRNRSSKLLRSPPAAPRSLGAPGEVAEIARSLGEVADSFESSMNAGLPGDKARGGFDSMLEAILRPLVEAVERSAAALDSSLTSDASPLVDTGGTGARRGGGGAAVLPAGAARMYLVNCLLAIWAPLSAHRCCASQAATLKSRAESEVEALASGEIERLLNRAGVAGTYQRALPYLAKRDITRPSPDDGPGPEPPAGPSQRMADDPGLTADAVTGALAALFVFVSAADAVPDYERLSAPRLRVAASRRVAQGLTRAYRELHAALGDPACGYGDGALAAVRHTPEQVATLLGVTEDGGGGEV